MTQPQKKSSVAGKTRAAVFTRAHKHYNDHLPQDDRPVTPAGQPAGAVEEADLYVLLRKGSKLPLPGRRWKQERVGYQLAYEHIMHTGGNLAYKIAPRVLVLDVDRRQNGHLSFDQLEKDLGGTGCGLRETMTVKTLDGTHYYYILPAPDMSLKGKLDGYDGVDVKANGFVLIAPSQRETKDGGLFDYTLPAGIPAHAPPGLLEKLTHPYTKVRRGENEPGGYTVGDIYVLLNELDPCAYTNKYEEWRNLMMSIHHATDGASEAFYIFVSWSKQDGKYLKADETAWRNTWDSLKTVIQGGSGNIITYKTLRHAVWSLGTDSARKAVRETDKSALMGGRALLDVKTIQLEEEEKARLHATALANNLSVSSTDEEEQQALEAIAKVQSPITRAKLTEFVRVQTGKKYNKKLLTDTVSSAVRRNKGGEKDRKVAKVTEASEEVLRRFYGDGEHLLIAGSPGRILHFPDGASNWTMIKDITSIHNKVQQVCDEMTIPKDVGVVTKHIINSLYQDDIPEPDEDSIALQNCELVLTRVACGARITPRPPRRASNHIGHLNVEWPFWRDGKQTDKTPNNYKEVCEALPTPMYDRTLRNAFGNFKEDTDEVIYHFDKILGYMCQPLKNRGALFVMWVGGALTGKSTLGRLVGKILGDKLVNREIVRLEEKYALWGTDGAYVLYDDDFPEKKPLPETVIKRTSEASYVEVQAKYLKAYTMKSVMTLLLLSNDYPKYNQSIGPILRRAQIFPFKNKVKDNALLGRERIDAEFEKERHAIYARWLFAYMDDINRGRETVTEAPACLRLEVEAWITGAHPVFLWRRDSCMLSPDSEYSLVDLYESGFTPWYERHSPGKKSYMPSRDTFKNKLSELEGVTTEERRDERTKVMRTIVRGLVCYGLEQSPDDTTAEADFENVL